MIFRQNVTCKTVFKSHNCFNSFSNKIPKVIVYRLHRRKISWKMPVSSVCLIINILPNKEIVLNTKKLNITNIFLSIFLEPSWLSCSFLCSLNSSQRHRALYTAVGTLHTVKLGQSLTSEFHTVQCGPFVLTIFLCFTWCLAFSPLICPVLIWCLNCSRPN